MRATIAWKSAAFFLVALLAGGALALGQSGETVGLITEIKVARGTAEVKTAAGVRRTARPLLALRAGDQIHTTEDAAVVVVLTAGRGAVRVDARTTPWTAPPVGDPGKFDKAQSLVTSSLRFLTGAQQEAAEALLISRAGGGPPRIVAPRGTILDDPVVVEWAGSPLARYGVRITSPTAVVIEQRDAPGSRFAYPADAPRLAAGVRYTVRVETRNRPPERATFDIAPPGQIVAIRAELADLERGVGPETTASSLAVLKAGLLASAGFFHDARATVMSALALDPDEPTLHTLLGAIYTKTGLNEEAAMAFREATSLLGRRR